jgi:hypothetical protein
MTQTATRQWGPWALQGTDLVIHAGSISEYPVDLLTCTSSAQVLDWVCQVAGRFAEGRDQEGRAALAWFVLAVDEILSPQATLCSHGKPTTLTQAAIREACAAA